MKDKLERFEDEEAKFIAKDIILKKLKIHPLNQKNISYSKKVRKVISHIESLENEWSYIPTSNSHSFGRKEKNEPIGFWSVPKMSAKVIANLILYTGAKNILEIGTSVGYSTLFLASAVKYNNGKVNTIELLSKKIEIARNNFRNSGLKNINLIQEDASKVLSDWKMEQIDLVFLDADKENYGKYFDQLIPLMSKGGLIVADNINDYGHMMEDYLQKVSGTHLPKSRCDPRVISTYLAQLDNGLMITKKL